MKDFFQFIGGFRLRLFAAFYLALVVHAIFIFYIINSGRIWDLPVICGPPRIYAQPLEEEKTLSFSIVNKNDSDGEDSEGSEEDEDSDGDGNSKFDRGKYKGGEWEDLVDRLDESKKVRNSFKNNFDNIIKDGSVPDSYINRKRDYEDIMVKEVYPTLYKIDKPFAEEVRKAPEDLENYKERNKIIDLYRNKSVEEDVLQVEIEAEDQKNTRAPLVMNQEQRMQYLDKNLKKKKEEQLKDFTSRFLNYNPDEGDLPLFLRDLYYQNLQRLAYPFSSDSTYFTIDYFQENLNKEDFLKNTLAMYSEFQNHKLGTEILFTLENIYDIQGRAVSMYFQNKELLSRMNEQEKEQLRVEVIRRVLERYQKIFQEKNIKSIDDVNRLYTKKRLEIMDTLIQNTPNNYRKADGLFEKARIHWEYSQTLAMEERIIEQSKAIQIWNGISAVHSTNGDFLNEKALAEVKNTLRTSQRSPDGMIDGNSQIAISSILRNRISEFLRAKSERESKLLWKKSKVN
ncbi:MAG: hypothetical protein MH321_12690 [Leptospiraceae bacterium]|nr:hypothetical protein [Leptospiraceae bacterium]